MSSRPMKPIREVVQYAAMAYHDEKAWNGLLTGVIRECERDARNAGCALLVTREWQRGPHLRLGLRGSADCLEQARLAIAARLNGLLTEHPSHSSMHPDDVRARASTIATRAGVELCEDWLPDNSVEWSPPVRYEMDADSTQRIIEDFHFAATPAALALLADHATVGTLSIACCDLMAATAETFGQHGLEAASRSYRSHAEAYLTLVADTAVRRAWDEAARRVHPQLRARLLAIASGAVRPGHVADWIDAVTPLASRAAMLGETGTLLLPSLDAGFSDDLMAASPFHRDIAASADWAEVAASAWFQTYRLVVNLLYLQMTRVGIRPITRHRLCHLVADACAPTTPSTTEAALA